MRTFHKDEPEQGSEVTDTPGGWTGVWRTPAPPGCLPEERRKSLGDQRPVGFGDVLAEADLQPGGGSAEDLEEASRTWKKFKGRPLLVRQQQCVDGNSDFKPVNGRPGFFWNLLEPRPDPAELKS